jgi:hypothetical protein
MTPIRRSVDPPQRSPFPSSTNYCEYCCEDVCGGEASEDEGVYSVGLCEAIASGGEDRAQEPHAPTLLLQLLTPAALLVKDIKSAAVLLDAPLDLGPSSSKAAWTS